ncbi:MAG: adenine deaminase [Desulfonatronovibrio sp.]
MKSYNRQEMIKAARAETKADLLLTNIKLVNTISGNIYPADVAVKNGIVLGPGQYSAPKVIDGKGAYLCPGFIEAHIHIESTLLDPLVFAETVASMGTSTVVCDPHEIANVLGAPGIEYFIQSTRDMPIDIYFMLSSCVPATSLENSGAKLGVTEMQKLLHKYPDRFPGLGEMMNFPGVIHQDPEVMAKLEMAENMVIDGHAPGLSGMDLNAYILAGPGSDHECVRLDEAREKLEKGMHIMIRQGTSQHNMADLLPLVNDHNWPFFSLVSDDRHPEDLADQGHVDDNLRRAVSLGLDPVRAVQMVTINPARYFGLKHRGAIAPGCFADMVLVDDLKDFNIRQVYLKGKALEDYTFQRRIAAPGNSMHIKELTESSFEIPALKEKVRAIQVIPGQIVTKTSIAKPVVRNNKALADAKNGLIKLAVVERHRATGNIGLGFVKGLGLERGALASTVAHDSHNLIIAGTNDRDMLVAAREAMNMAGGLIAVQDAKVLGAVPLPIAGLMSDKPLKNVVGFMRELDMACHAMGMTHSNPFMILSFLALPVIPELKLTDKGLVDVSKFEIVDLWVD